MLKSLSSAVSGLQNQQTLMDVIGNNIANVNTSAFRASRVVFSDVYYQTISSASGTASGGGRNATQIGYGSSVASIDVLNDDASYTETGRALDVYIDGDGYFIIEDANGGQCYTKLGNFYFDVSGNLVDSNGNYVCNNTPAAIHVANLDDYSSISIDSTGKITGVAIATGTTTNLGQIGLAYFANEDGLSQDGDGYYTTSLNSGAAQVTIPGSNSTGLLISGALESSNVDLTDEFTNMIIAERGYQANARVITTSDEMLEELVNLKR